ncbi:MAG: Tol-Pal system beta propeller repeat protein TolB [Gammaproteobacteria bacterium]|nr:Tol-Pal system beta propeller repeat protein TolB [Gammaproteobacteria bacterium]
MTGYLLLAVWSPSHAAVDLELTQGVKSTIPIAIVPFDGNASSTELLDMSAIINADLQNSGRFNVLDRAKISEKPQNAEQVNAATWQKLGMDNVVVGTVRPTPDGKYQVNFQLVDTNSARKDSAEAKLLTKEFMVPNKGMRKLAHHISDLVYEKLTGDKGIFSTHIAYVVVEKNRNIPVRYRLEVSDIDGYDPRSLIVSKEPIMSPSWSPDGNRIAYVSFEKNHAGIYIQEIASGNRRLVTDYPGINGAPSWSPDGSKLAFTLSKEGSPSIYTLDLVSNGLVQRTSGGSIDTEPSWAPDGKSLIFTSNRSGGPQLYRVDLASGGVQRVTYEGNYNVSGTFSPDGKNIVMLHQEAGAYSIAIQNLQNGKIDILTETGRDQSPRIAPNGSMVVFSTKSGSKQILGMVSTDAHVQLRLPPREGDVREPAWSPL